MATGDHEGTSEERTPLPGVEVLAVLAYLYAEAGIRARMLGATDEERLAHAAVRQDIRELAEHFEMGRPRGIYPPGHDDYLFPGNYAKRAKWEKPLEPPHDRYGRVYPPPAKDRGEAL